MAKKLTQTQRICQLLRGSFNKASVGDDTEARRLWKLAIKAGYVPDPHTEKGLEIAIRKGIKETRR